MGFGSTEKRWHQSRRSGHRPCRWPVRYDRRLPVDGVIAKMVAFYYPMNAIPVQMTATYHPRHGRSTSTIRPRFDRNQGTLKAESSMAQIFQAEPRLFRRLDLAGFLRRRSGAE